MSSFALGRFYEYAHEWAEFASCLTCLVERLLCEHAATAFNDIRPVEERSIAQALQVPAPLHDG